MKRDKKFLLMIRRQIIIKYIVMTSIYSQKTITFTLSFSANSLTLSSAVIK